MLGQELQELREERLVAQARQRDVAEDANLALGLGQAAHDLHAAQKQHVVDGGDHPAGFRSGQVLCGHHHPAALIAQAGIALVIHRPPLRQIDDGLEVEVDPVLGKGFAHRVHQKRRLMIAGRIGRGVGACGRL